MNQLDKSSIMRFLEVLCVSSGHVRELRVLKAGQDGTVSGYYDDPQALAKDAALWDGKAPGVYITLNPVDPALMARANNRAKVRAVNTSTDSDILRREWILIDFDPKRQAGISSTDDEHRVAIELAYQCMWWLIHHGVPRDSIIKADSGNGAHLLIRVNLPNDEDSTAVVRRFLQAIDFKFGSNQIEIDQKVWNAARIVKLYGTLTAKGDNVSDRPHRHSRLLVVPPTIEIASTDLLHAIARMVPEEPKQGREYKGNSVSFDVASWIKKHELSVSRVKSWNGGTLYQLAECPFNPEHNHGEVSIIQFPSGAVSFQCMHNSCRDYHWHDLRDLLEPGWKTKVALREPQENKRIALKETVDGALERYACHDIDALFQAEIVGALAVLEREFPADYAGVKAKINQSNIKIPWRELNHAMKQYRQEHSRLHVVGPNEQAQARTVGSMLSDAPIGGLVVPQPYTLGEKGIVRHNDSGQRIALAPVIITGLLTDVDHPRNAIQLSWRWGSKWLHTTVDREVAMTAQKLTACAKEGFPVTSRNSGELVDYIAQFEAVNLDKLPIAKVSSHLGWQGRDRTNGFLWGKTYIKMTGEEVHDPNFDAMEISEWKDDVVSFRGLDIGDEQLASGFHSHGTIDGWIRTVAQAAQYPRAMVGLYTAFVPTVMDILGCPNFVLDISHDTSTGKSTIQRVAASAVGNPDQKSPNSAMYTWDVTKTWVEHASAVLNHLPLILDDTKTCRYPKLITDTLYMIHSGRGRGRGNTNSLSASRTWTTVLISSGEVPIGSFSKQDGGVKGRVLQITGTPFDGAGDNSWELVEELNASLKVHYGHALPLFVKWVVKNQDKWPQWVEDYRQYVDQYAARASTEVGYRLSAFAAAITFTSLLVHDSFADAGHPFPWKWVDPIEPLWNEIVSEAADAVGAEEALKLIMSWANANEHNFYGRHKKEPNDNPKAPPQWLGKWDASDSWTSIGFKPAPLKSYLTELGFNAEEILRKFKHRNWLELPKSASQRGYLKQLRIDKNKAPDWLVVITRDAIESLAEVDGTD